MKKIENAEHLLKRKDKCIAMIQDKIDKIVIEKEGIMKEINTLKEAKEIEELCVLKIVEEKKKTKIKNDVLQQKMIQIEQELLKGKKKSKVLEVEIKQLHMQIRK